MSNEKPIGKRMVVLQWRDRDGVWRTVDGIPALPYDEKVTWSVCKVETKGVRIFRFIMN